MAVSLSAGPAALDQAPDGYDPHVERVEVDLLLEGIYRQYGHDFRSYARSSIRRRIWRRVREDGLPNLTALQERVLHDPDAMNVLLLDLTVGVTAMFRDPKFFVAFRKHAVPLLRTYPFIRIWHAGCSTGEEAYSMAILLQEEGLYDRARIYATDINEVAVQQARTGVVSLERMQEYTQNYLRAGGSGAFCEHYMAGDGGAVLHPSLLENIVFAQHNLVTDGSFSECNVILCRNVLIYFSRPLQQRVHGLFYDSLGMFGLLALGSKESLKFTGHESCYEQLCKPGKIYRKIK